MKHARVHGKPLAKILAYPVLGESPGDQGTAKLIGGPGYLEPSI